MRSADSRPAPMRGLGLHVAACTHPVRALLIHCLHHCNDMRLRHTRTVPETNGVPHAVPILYGDSQSGIAAATNGVRTERSKHIDIKYRFITDVIERGRQILQWVPTQEQQADILTKALPAPQFERLRKKIMGS